MSRAGLLGRSLARGLLLGIFLGLAGLAPAGDLVAGPGTGNGPDLPPDELSGPTLALDPEPASRLFDEAGDLYEQGDFAGAAGRYRRLVEAGVADAVVLYNLGNCLYRLGRTGPAILAYEKAAVLDPGDSDLQENLEFVSSQIVDHVKESEAGEGPLAALWAWHGRWSPAVITSLFLAAWLFFNACLAVIIITHWPWWRHLAGYALTMALVMVFLTGTALGLLVYRRDTVVHGIVLSAPVNLQSGPGRGKTLTTVHEGLKVRVQDAHGDWLKVLLPNGLQGWVPGRVVGIV